MGSPATFFSASLPVFTLRALSPALVLLSSLSLLLVHPPPPSDPSPITPVVVASHVPRRTLILSFLSLSAFTFLLDGLTLAVQAVIYKNWPPHTGIEINALLGIVAFAGLAALGAWKELQGVNVWFLNRIKLAIAAAFALDIALAVLLGFRLKNIPTDAPPTLTLPALLHFAFPVLRLLLSVPLLAALFSPRTVYTVQSDNGIEDLPTSSSLLLPPTLQPSTGLSPSPPPHNDSTKYGTFRTTRSDLQRSATTTRAPTRAPTPAPSPAFASKTDVKPDVSFDPSWAELWKRLRRFTPYLWPSKNRYLQLLASLCIFVLFLGRVINLAMPLVLAQLIRTLEARRSPWPYLFAYVGLRFLQGSGGLAAVRESLWAPVMQYSDREMSQLSFDHLLNLSFAWHTRRKTGEILRILDRGAAINRSFELILFNIVPTFIDIFVALVTFSFLFEWTLGLVLFLVMFAYVAASVTLTQWRTKLRRQMNERDVITRGIHTDCLLNYETVKYFGGEEHEGERYRDALREYQALEYKVIISLNFLNMVQNLIITLGLLVGSMLLALRVTKGLSDSGDFVLFITYLSQLYGPLNQLGSIYRGINQRLVDSEKLLNLLNEPTEVNDQPGAPDLIVNHGEIEFENVNFSYDGRTSALNGVSFKVPKGSSVALVGESGAGKSTILRLLYRFYDLKEGEGRILIDGQDIRDVTQKSLRQAIGVVPQDSILFNSSIAYNIGYGKFGASLDEIEAAAKSAQMHDKIMTFPDGYETKVGERGVRLSGGEKQRVAIARTLLKNPPVLLLDEATSALDTATEKDIQKALQNLVQGRSSLSIAHRLSTIATADLILVLRDGHIVERGNHRELLALDGIFAAMWAEQVSTSDDQVEDNIVKAEVSGYVIGDPVAEQVESGNVESTNPSLAEPSAVVEPDVQVAEPSVVVEPDVRVAEPSAVIEPDVQVAEPSVVVEPDVRGDTRPLVEEPVSEAVHVDDIPPESSPVAFPTSGSEEAVTAFTETPAGDATPTRLLDPGASPLVAEPLAFPTTDVPTPERVATPTPGPAVTFETSGSPSRTGTPDPDGETKRRRISSQNFQRLARRISITTRRQSSLIIPGIPGLKKDSSKVSTDDTGNDSGSGSIKGDTGKSKLKKEKKEKDRKS